MSIYEKINFTMFVVKLGTPSRANYEHFHVYLAYRRQTGTVVTRQTYDRSPRLTRPPTAHISRGAYDEHPRIYPILNIGKSWFVCWSLTSLCHSNGHIETMSAREINPFTALIRIRSQFLRTQ